MLKLMRENAGSWIIKILLGVVVLVFIFLGIGPGRIKNQNVAAVVNKKVISMDAFRSAYNNVLQRYRSQFGNDLNDEFIKMLKIKSNTLESLIDKELILQEAEKYSIKVTDEEVQKVISSISSFQENGHFSQGRYSNYIKYSRQSPELFESMQRDELMLRKFQALIFEPAPVSDDEVKAWYTWEKTGARIDYVFFESAGFKDLKPSDEEVTAYYEKHADQYRALPSVKVNYLRFSPDDYASSVTIADQDVEAYYKANEDKYTLPKRVAARHILIKVDENAPEADVEAKRLKAQEIYELAIKDGQDFSQLARTYSEDTSKDKGGDLGTFEEGQMVQPFSDKAFSMKAGEISEPVRTRYGWHVIKVEKVMESSVRQLAEVKPEIEKILVKEKAENLAYENVDMVYDGIISGNTLEKAAEISGRKLIDTGWFTDANGPAGIDASLRRNFSTTAFEVAENGISDILELGGSYYILQVTGKKGSDIQPLAEVKEQVEANLIKEMQENKAKEAAASLIAAIKEGKTSLDKAEGFKETPTFTRDNRGTEMGIDSNVVMAAFGLSTEKPLSEEPVKGLNGYYVIQLKEKTDPDPALLEKEKDRIMSELKEKKQAQVYKHWMSQLKAKSKIERSSELME